MGYWLSEGEVYGDDQAFTPNPGNVANYFENGQNTFALFAGGGGGVGTGGLKLYNFGGGPVPEQLKKYEAQYGMATPYQVWAATSPSGPGNNQSGGGLDKLIELGIGATYAYAGGNALMGAAGAGAGAQGLNLSSYGPAFADGTLAGGVGGAGLEGAAASWGVNAPLSEFVGDLPYDLGNPAYPGGPQIDPSFTSTTVPSTPGYNPSWFPSLDPAYVDAFSKATGMTGSALTRALGQLTGNGEASLADWLSLAGTAGSTLLGLLGANSQQNAQKDAASQMQANADRYFGMGQPYRDELSSLTANPGSFLTSPRVTTSVDQGTSALARALSTQGNPAGSGSALHQIQNYATNSLYGQLQNRENQLANFGGLSNFNAAAPGAASSAITANAAAGSNQGVYGVLQSGLADLTNPGPSLADLLKQYGNYNRLGL